jgi:hypothetical protein
MKNKTKLKRLAIMNKTMMSKLKSLMNTDETLGKVKILS